MPGCRERGRLELQAGILGREERCGARAQAWTTILSQVLAVHLEEDVVSNLGPSGAVNPPSTACTDAGV